MEPICLSPSLDQLASSSSQTGLRYLGRFQFRSHPCLRSAQGHPRLLARAVHALDNTPSVYRSIRATPLSSLPPLARAAHFIYLNRYCFNGVYRTNRQGQFNVPMGKRTGSVPDPAAFSRCSIALRSAQLLAADFEFTCARARSGDFVYLDPPYSSSRRPTYGEYGYASFQSTDLGRLSRCLRDLDRRGCFFLLSYAETPKIPDLRRCWHTSSIPVKRHVAGFARHRRTVQEVLISNYIPGSQHA